MEHMNPKYMPGQPETDESAKQYQQRISPLIDCLAKGCEMYGDDFFETQEETT